MENADGDAGGGDRMEKRKKIWLLDSTLRDGAQGEDISFSVQDKLNIVQILDRLGIDYIEAGNPGSNPKDLEFFERVQALRLHHAKLVAFGSTRRKNESVQEDRNLLSLLDAQTSVVSIFGKSWDFHVTEIIHTTLEENLRMIEETVAFLKENGREVIYDAEHFFDGYRHNPDYAVQTVLAAQRGGADSICLCETNGGAFPDEVFRIVGEVGKRLSVPIGIHTHDDSGMAVANSIMAVQAGAVCVQGTLIGIGERCGNANLSTVLSNLQLKCNCECIPPENLHKLMQSCHMISEVSNVQLNKNMPYIGKSAFAHKGGMHIDGVNKAPSSFEHINPESVGNSRRFLMSEVAGRSTLIEKIQRVDAKICREDPVTAQIIGRIKEMEHQGYQFEGADATLEMLIRKQLGNYHPFFKVEKFKTMGEQQNGEENPSATAMVKVVVNGQSEMTAAEGNGPVNALDSALRKALERFYPVLQSVHLTDYKVRVLDSRDRTASKVRVLIESTDGREFWTTVGVSVDIIEASLDALVASIEYKLIHSSPFQMDSYRMQQYREQRR